MIPHLSSFLFQSFSFLVFLLIVSICLYFDRYPLSVSLDDLQRQNELALRDEEDKRNKDVGLFLILILYCLYNQLREQER